MVDNFDLEELEQFLSVSSGDALSVSGNDNALTNVYIIGIPQEQQETATETAYTIFNKPLEEYTVSEGLLVILVILAIVCVVYKIVKGGFIPWRNIF